MTVAKVTILGATGYAGRLVAAEAARQGLEVCLAGRRRDALERLASDLGVHDSCVAVASVEDPPSLTRLAQSSSVLVNTVGAYSRLGQPVVDAALGAGCHYLDVAAEVDFVAWAYERHPSAEEAGVTLCPACGVNGAVGDLLASLAAARIGAHANEARAAYLVRGARLSAGSIRSALDVAAGGGAAWLAGRLVNEPVGASRWRVPFPSPLGPRGAVSVPTPDVLTVARSTGAGTARAYVALPASRAVGVLARPLDRVARKLLRTRLAHRVPDWLPEGPDASTRRSTRMAVLAEVVGAGGVGRVWADGRDLYGTTARLVVGVARRLHEADDPPGGVRTPAQIAGEDLGGLLNEAGLRWTLL